MSIKINEVNIKFKSDNGAAYTIVSKNVAEKNSSDKLPSGNYNTKLQTYTKGSLTVLDELKVKVLLMIIVYLI